MSSSPDDPEQSEADSSASARSETLPRRHWYSRITPGARSFFWSIYFGIFVLAAVTGIVFALIQMANDPRHLMHNPYSSIFVLVTGVIGEMYSFHRNLAIYMVGLPGRQYARYGIYIAGTALTVAFLLGVVIVVLYMLQ